MSAAAPTSTFRTVIPLMSIPRMAPATCAASSAEAGELHAARLAPPADEDLGLDDDLAPSALPKEALGGGPGLVDGVGDLPGGDREPLGERAATSRRLPGSSRASGLRQVGLGGCLMVPRVGPVALPGERTRYNRGHGPSSHPDPRRRHRSGAGGGDTSCPRRVGGRVRVGDRRRGRGRHRRLRDAAAGPRPRVDPAQQGRAQGPDHDPGRRGVPQRQRRAPPGARAVRQPPTRRARSRASRRATRTSTS